jgi:hypothetical protein
MRLLYSDHRQESVNTDDRSGRGVQRYEHYRGHKCLSHRDHGADDPTVLLAAKLDPDKNGQ